MQKELEAILLEMSKTEEIDSGDMRIAGEKIVLNCCKGLNILRASMWKVQRDRISCEVLADKRALVDNEGLFLLREDFPNYFKALDMERVIAASNAETHSATSEFTESYLRPLNIKSMLDVPIRHKGKMVGIICCEHQGEEIKCWTDDEIVFVSTLAELSGRALNAYLRKQYEKELQNINQKLQQMVDEQTSALKQTVEDLKSTQEQLVESEKMAALGSLVSGVAHEVNTPLGVAITSISVCMEQNKQLLKSLDSNGLSKSELLSSLQTEEDALLLASNNLNRAAQLIHDFKQTSVDQTSLRLEEIELNDYLSHVLNTLSPLLKEKCIDLVVQFGSEVNMTTYPGLLAQIMTNLVTNTTTHAFVDGDTKPRVVTVKVNAIEGKAQIEFSDNGKGINQANLKQIFEPFYTTNRSQGGTGLGLSIVYNIVSQKMAGKISVSSVENEGVRFSILLPLTLSR